MAKVRIVGLGTYEGDDVCELSGGRATGYIECPVTHDEVACDLKLLGPGQIGQLVECPEEIYKNYMNKVTVDHGGSD